MLQLNDRFEISTEHGNITAVHCAKCQNDWTIETVVMDERDFARFQFKMSFGRISYIAQYQGLVASGLGNSTVIPAKWIMIKQIPTQITIVKISSAKWLLFRLWPSDAIWRYGFSSALAEVLACCVMTASHHLNLHCFLISDVLWHSTGRNSAGIGRAHTLHYLKTILLKSLQCLPPANVLTHWGRVTLICVGNLTIIGSDNGLLPGRRQAITWTNVEILLIGPLGTKFSEMLIEIHTFSFKKIHLKMSSGKESTPWLHNGTQGLLCLALANQLPTNKQPLWYKIPLVPTVLCFKRGSWCL